jgi:hypothetical protein
MTIWLFNIDIDQAIQQGNRVPEVQAAATPDRQPGATKTGQGRGPV